MLVDLKAFLDLAQGDESDVGIREPLAVRKVSIR
jgi:hypothetical protein